jgi:hypothetical protein
LRVCSETESLNTNGDCIKCPEFSRGVIKTYGGYKFAKTCAPDKCSPAERLLFDGTCKDCPEYSYPAELDPKDPKDRLKKDCKHDVCLNHYKLDKDGRCSKCPDYQRSTGEGYVCDEPICPDG